MNYWTPEIVDLFKEIGVNANKYQIEKMASWVEDTVDCEIKEYVDNMDSYR